MCNTMDLKNFSKFSILYILNICVSYTMPNLDPGTCEKDPTYKNGFGTLETVKSVQIW